MENPIRNLARLESESFYHVFNRTNNKETLFKNSDDHHFFLDRTKRYLSGYFEIYAYCLIGNHFHLLVKTKPTQVILSELRSKSKVELIKSEIKLTEVDDLDQEAIHDMYRIQLLRLFTAYSKNYNRLYGRSGNLFYRPFKRILVSDLEYVKSIILYIHKNPVKHLLTKDFKNFEWSSYYDYLNEESKIIDIEKRIEIFGSMDAFNHLHNSKNSYEDIAELLLE